jgi:zinc and cadmium transporter
VDGFGWLVAASGGGAALGGLLPILGARRGEPHPAVHGFAAGTLLGAALFFLLPESVETLGRRVGLPVVGGFLVLYLLDRLLLESEIHHDEGHAEVGHAHHLGTLAIVGFLFHTVADGAALGLASERPEVRLAVWVGILLHEMVAAGASRARIAAVVLGLAGLLVVSALTAAWAAGAVPARVVAVGLGASAGMFVFLATSELLPRVHVGRPGRALAIVTFLAGLAGALAAAELGHAHG